MRIGIDASRANVTERTGTEWYSLEILRALIRQSPNDEFTLYLQRPPLPEIARLGPNVRLRVLHWPPRLLWSQLRLSWEMWRRKPDVLFVPAHTVPLVHPKRTIVTIHDLGFEHFPELYAQTYIGGPRLGRLLNVIIRLFTLGKYGSSELSYHRWSARLAVRTASDIITVSHYTKSDLVQRYQASPNRITTIYHGFNPDTYQPASSETLAALKHQFQLTKPYILYVGRLERKKNIIRLLKVFAAVSREHDLDLVLIGTPGTGWEEATEVIQREKISHRIHQLGWQPTTIYVGLLTGAELLFFPSHFEGFGMPVIEAFAVGTPVVTSKTTSLPEVAGDAAQLVDPNDVDDMAQAIGRVLTNKNLRNSLIEKGRARAQIFTWEAAGAQTRAVIVGQKSA